MSMKFAQRAGSVLSIFAVMLLAGCGGGGGDDNDDDSCPSAANNVTETGSAHTTSGTAQTIPLSSSVAGSISDSPNFTLSDWYRFVLSATTTVTMRLCGPSNQDIDLVLYASDGTTVIDYSIGSESNESISRSLAAGTYFIVVEPFDVTAVSNYTLVVQ